MLNGGESGLEEAEQKTKCCSFMSCRALGIIDIITEYM